MGIYVTNQNLSLYMVFGFVERIYIQIIRRISRGKKKLYLFYKLYYNIAIKL